MKQRMISQNRFHAVLLAVMWMAGWSALAAPVGQATEPKLATRSVFTQPSIPSEGRDPFFPSSLRPYQGTVVPGAADNVGALTLQGFSGPPDHQLVIINNVTFAVGDDAEVSTSQGRIHIHCLEIGTNSAVIEANGQRHELRYSEKP